jgi:hypothetical protein
MPEPQIEWLKDGKPLESLSGIKTESDGGIKRLIIECAEKIHEASYTCAAENLIGKAETSANLRVESKDFKFFYLFYSNKYKNFKQVHLYLLVL